MIRKSNLSTQTSTAHTHTMFDKLATEATLQRVLEATGGGGGTTGDVNIVESIPLSVNTISGFNLESTQSTISTNISTTLPLFTFEPLGGAQNNALKTRVENFPTSFEVSNFPATQPVSIADAISISNTSFEVSNFPTSFEVSNFPATQAVSIADAISISNTSFEVSNFPATQAVSIADAISISNTSFEVSNFPATQAVSIADAISISNTSFEVSNFPATQAVSIADAISISNTSFEVSNFPTTQAVSIADAISISNTSFEVSNFPATQAVSIADAISISNTSFEVSNFPATQAVSIADAISISNTSFEVSNFPTTQAVSIADAISISNTSFEISNLPTTQPVSIANAVSVNVLDTNSTVYDYTNDKDTMTQTDDRFIIDRVRPDSWAFINDKNQTGSNVFWYSNTVTSPLGAQEFPILHGDLQSLYFVAGINRTSDINACPFMAVYSPSNIAFYTSRWVYTIDPSEKLIQTEKVLLYYGDDPVNIYTNLRHLQLLKNVIASQGPQLETETCYLISINTASSLTASSVYYNLYNAGWILNDGVHNDYAFNSGIKSKGDLLLSKLNIAGDATSLAVAISNVVSCGIENASYTTIDSNSCLNVNVGNTDVPVSNTALNFMSFKEVAGSTYGLEVVNRNVQQSTNYLFTETDITITDETPSIDVRTFRLMSVFGNSTHTGGGSHDIVIQYSTNNSIWYDSPNVIPSVANKFAFDLKDFCVSYIRFRFQVEITDLNMNVCLK